MNKTSLKTAKITVKTLEALTQENDNEILREPGGLVGKVRAGIRGITVLFRYEFSQGGKKDDFRLGSWPKKTLHEIRVARDAARKQVNDGVKPAAAKKAAKIEAQSLVEEIIAKAQKEKTEALTVNDLFEAWIANGVSRKDGNAELLRNFNSNVLPAIGKIKVADLSESELLSMLKGVKKRALYKDPQRALNRTVETIYLNTRQMLKWAEKRQPWRRLMIEGNPIDLVELKHIKNLQDEGYSNIRDRVLTEAEIKELHEIFNKLESDYNDLGAGEKYSGIRPVNKRVQCAVWICLSTICRIGELLMAKWEHIDFDKNTWFIPADNTKGIKGKRQDHLIALSNFSMNQFKQLYVETGSTEFCFPSKEKMSHVCVKTVSKLIGDRQAQFKNRSKPLSGRQHNNTLVLSDGKRGEWTPHDLRRTGATMMQSLGIPLDIIDRCQNHVMDQSKVRRHYMHYDYAKEKADAWKIWGEAIQSIINNGNGINTDMEVLI